MARSVVLRPAVRCEQCRFSPRWCICAAFEAVTTPLEVDVLMHWREFDRPSSTGSLISRVLPASRRHRFRPEAPPRRETIARPDRELWILHPRGEAPPVGVPPEKVQVLLLDGSWRESVQMVQAVGAWGRPIRLPVAGPSRNELRRQEGPGLYSTMESLLFLLSALGEHDAERRLRLQFELHVYAGLKTRGAKARAEAFLATSPIREAFPALLHQLAVRRPVMPTGG